MTRWRSPGLYPVTPSGAGLGRGRPGKIGAWVQMITGLLLSVCMASWNAAGSTPPPNYRTQGERTDAPAGGRQLETGQDSPVPLVESSFMERQLSGGETHKYGLGLAEGQFARVVVNQKGIDVILRLFRPDGKAVVEMDSLNATQGFESIGVVAEQAGDYRLDISSPDKWVRLGKYEVKVEALRFSTEIDRTWAAAQRSCYDGWNAYLQTSGEAKRRAIREFNKAAELWREAGDPMKQAHALMYMGECFRSLGQPRQAEAAYLQALSLQEREGTPQEIVHTLGYLATAYNELADPQCALEYSFRARIIWRDLNDTYNEARTMLNIGVAYSSKGDHHEALDYYGRALAVWEKLKDERDQADTLSYMGESFRGLGEPQRALDHFRKALAIYQNLKAGRHRASLLAKFGAVYQDLGEWEDALEFYRQALPVWRAVGDTMGEAITLSNIGLAHASLQEFDLALERYREALGLHRKVGDDRSEANTLHRIGILYLDRGDAAKAVEYFEQARQRLAGVGDQWSEALLQTSMGFAREAMGDVQGATRLFESALEQFHLEGDRSSEARALVGLARSTMAQGRLPESRIHLEAALALLESVRADVRSSDLRASFLAKKMSAHELYVDLLMRMHRFDPAGGYQKEALVAAERARARSLLEMLSGLGTDIRQGVDAELLEQERELRLRLNGREDYRMQLWRRKSTEAERQVTDNEVAAIVAELREIEGQIRARSPGFAALTQPQPLGVKEIQEQVVDSETLLLEYTLGQERSYLWAVTPDSVVAFELPNRAEIEALARRVYELMRTSYSAAAKAEGEVAVRALSRILLGPVADRLGSKRLLIVSDGALQYLPFGALTASAGESPTAVPLIVEHEVIYLPSASVLGALRRELAGRQPAAKTLAVLADPVFEVNDERIKVRTAASGVGRIVGRPAGNGAEGDLSEDRKVAVPPAGRASLPPSDSAPADPSRAVMRDVERSAKESGLASFPRLRFTRREAETIAMAAPKTQALKALDFNASRQTAMSGALSEYRIVHFATHGLLNSQHPQLSGLVLSLVDEQGKPQDGFLRAHEIFNLRLPAELVVLSGCRTALGKEVRGEGLIGLTRGFMYAGAPRVMVSLWNVSDEATAELMKRFYGAMLKDGLKPAAALRVAQISMGKETRWKASYYWAAFILQGEWK